MVGSDHAVYVTVNVDLCMSQRSVAFEAPSSKSYTIYTVKRLVGLDMTGMKPMSFAVSMLRQRFDAKDANGQIKRLASKEGLSKLLSSLY